MINYEHYTYKVTWSVEDQEFVGLCAEYPSVSYRDENRHAALEGITDLVKDVVANMEANSENIPEFIAEKSYSGKFQVHITSDLYRKLAITAAEENVSLNRSINHKLAC